MYILFAQNRLKKLEIKNCKYPLVEWNFRRLYAYTGRKRKIFLLTLVALICTYLYRFNFEKLCTFVRF